MGGDPLRSSPLRSGRCYAAFSWTKRKTPQRCRRGTIARKLLKLAGQQKGDKRAIKTRRRVGLAISIAADAADSAGQAPAALAAVILKL